MCVQLTSNGLAVGEWDGLLGQRLSIHQMINVIASNTVLPIDDQNNMGHSVDKMQGLKSIWQMLLEWAAKNQLLWFQITQQWSPWSPYSEWKERCARTGSIYKQGRNLPTEWLRSMLHNVAASWFKSHWADASIPACATLFIYTRAYKSQMKVQRVSAYT
jgi:hypothetical protein